MTPTPDATSPASQVGATTPKAILRNQIMNPNIPKSEAEHWAARVIRDLEAENARLRSAPIPAVQSGAVAWLIQWDDRHRIHTRVQLGDVVEPAVHQFAPTKTPLYAAPQSEPLPGVREPFTVDDLAQEIRRVDGNHDLGAGALAEALSPFIIERIYQGLVAVSRPPLPGGVGEAMRKAIAVVLDAAWGEGLNEVQLDEEKHIDAILAALSGKEQSNG